MLFRSMGLTDAEIIIYSSTQHTMRSELINRIMGALADNGIDQE